MASPTRPLTSASPRPMIASAARGGAEPRRAGAVRLLCEPTLDRGNRRCTQVVVLMSSLRRLRRARPAFYHK